MHGEAVRVGVVDSGAAPRHSAWVEACAAFNLSGGEVVQRDAGEDALGHGSALIDVIATLAPGTRFVVAQVFGERLTTTAAQVAAAIDWLVSQRVALINLSLGLSRDREALAGACHRALRAGVILCAASPARGEAVFPAAYPGVFRMTGDARCARSELSHLNTRHADFGAHVRPLEGCKVAGGASLGCAHLTGHLACYLAAGGSPRLSAARAWLIAQAAYHGPEFRR